MTMQPSEPTATAASTETLVARYLELLAQGGSDLAATALVDTTRRDEVLARVAELQRLGFVATATASPPPAGQLQLGPYLVQSLLGRGGMGTVHLAQHKTLHRKAAIKCMLPTSLGDPQAAARFQREAMTLARLQHQGIVGILDVGHDLGVPWYAMELVEGPSLDHLLALRRAEPDLPIVALLTKAGLSHAAAERLGTRSWPLLCAQIVRDAAAAVGHAHDHGLVHRDLKPGNLMLRADGRVVVVDFGLCAGAGVDKLTRTGEFVGSPLYSAPEQVVGTVRSAPTLDVWALGLVLGELLTGEHPFAGRNGREPSARHGEGLLAGWRRHLRLLPRGLQAICERATELEPRRRYADARALAEDLDNALAARPVHARNTPLWRRVLWRLQRRRGLVAAAVILVVMLGMAWLDARRSEAEMNLLARLTAKYASGASGGGAAAVAQDAADPEVLTLSPRVGAPVHMLLGEQARRYRDFDLAAEQLDRCVALLRRLGRRDVAYGRALANLAVVQTVLRRAAAASLFDEAMEVLRSVDGQDPLETLRWRFEHCRGVCLEDAHRAHALCDGLLADLPKERTDLLPLRIDALAWYGLRKALNQRVAEGKILLDEARELLPRVGGGALAVRVAAAHAHWLRLAGDLDGSLTLFNATIQQAVNVHGDDAFEVLDIRMERAFLLREKGDADALSSLLAVLGQLDRCVRPWDAHRLDVAEVIGRLQRESGRFAAAVPLLVERWDAFVEGRRRQGLPVGDLAAGMALGQIGEARAFSGDLVGGEADLRSAIRHLECESQEQGRNCALANVRRVLGRVLGKAGRAAESEAELRLALEHGWWSIGPEPLSYLETLSELEVALRSQGRDAELLEVHARQIARIRERQAAIEDYSQTDARWRAAGRGAALLVLGDVRRRAGKLQEATVDLRQAIEHLTDGLATTHRFTQAARASLALAEAGR